MKVASSKPITGYDFIILSTQDWNSLPTRKHRFARWWAESGNRILYVEQQMHWAGWLVDLKCQLTRPLQWLQGPRLVDTNLWIFTLPIVLPFFQMSRLINWINNLFLLPILRLQLRRLGFENVILWTYTPHSAEFIGRLNETADIYEIVDDFVSARGLISAKAISRMERKVIESVDLVIVTAPALLESKKEGAKNIELVPNGVETEHFAHAADPNTPVAESFAQLKHPVIGLLGTMNYWIDTELIARIAHAHPNWTIAHVGPRDLLANTAPLENLPNLVSTGRIPYQELPYYVKAFDVCVNPYVMDGIAEHCSPLKLYEYIATGKPIVSVDMPEAHVFEELIHIAHSSDEFIELVERAVHENDGLTDVRLAEAKNHSWRERFERVHCSLEQVLDKKFL